MSLLRVSKADAAESICTSKHAYTLCFNLSILSFFSTPELLLTLSNHSLACLSCDSVKAMWLFFSALAFFSWTPLNPNSSACSRKFRNQDCASSERIFLSSMISLEPSPFNHSCLSAVVSSNEVLGEAVLVFLRWYLLLDLCFSCSIEFVCTLMSHTSFVGIITSALSMSCCSVKKLDR